MFHVKGEVYLKGSLLSGDAHALLRIFVMDPLNDVRYREGFNTSVMKENETEEMLFSRSLQPRPLSPVLRTSLIGTVQAISNSISSFSRLVQAFFLGILRPDVRYLPSKAKS